MGEVDEPSGAAARGEVTALLVAWQGGDGGALERLLPLVYDELRLIARAKMRREPAGSTLQATALVHEAYLRLIDQTRVEWKNRGHFFSVAAQAMRRILVDRARARRAEKRGSGEAPLHRIGDALGFEVAGETPVEPIDVLALDEALGRLADADPEQARIVELRFFAGLTLEETAEAVERSLATVKRDWRTARAFLHRELGLAGNAR